jgi:hypothetical protein
MEWSISRQAHVHRTGEERTKQPLLPTSLAVMAATATAALPEVSVVAIFLFESL